MLMLKEHSILNKSMIFKNIFKRKSVSSLNCRNRFLSYFVVQICLSARHCLIKFSGAPV